jgi:hypothetical protein
MSARASRFAWTLLLLAAPVRAQAPAPDTLAEARASSAPAEPPPEAGEGDYVAELADSLDPGWVETTIATRGRAGSAPRSDERLRFSGGGAAGSLRGGDDPLSGSRIEVPLAHGALHVGRLAPRWGRGLVLGSPAQPWAIEAEDRGEGSALRGHTGDGAVLALGSGGAVELLAGRFAKRPLAGARVRAGPASLGAVGDGADVQTSAAVSGGGGAAELVMSRAGRWRAELLARGGGRFAPALRVRAGLAGFRSLAEPRRAGPARALAFSASRAISRTRASVQGALWAFASGASGARGCLELQQRLVHHDVVDLGLEEQHGTRRDPALAASPPAAAGMRQGGWCEWRGRRAGRALALRHELWGARAFARRASRRAMAARAESPLPWGARLTLSHVVWSAHGEPLYLVEVDPDRLTLRASSGEGERTRVELAAPFGGGRARAGAEWTWSATRKAAPGWSIQWTRRARQ